MPKPDFLVCGDISAEDSMLDQCSKCGALVYPTIGSHARARREGVPLLCIACWRKLPNPTFGGMMHHGKLLPERLAKKIHEDFQKALADGK
jgi:hypothetical protein